MSESRAKLEQVLELLLAEENDKAEELLHEYVVAKARSEYERVLEAEDEVEESTEEESVEESEEVGEVVNKTNDLEDELTTDENEIFKDEAGIEEAEDEEGEESEGGEGEEDLEDKVDDLEDELEELRAEFEKLMAGEEGEEEHSDMDSMDDMGDAAPAADGDMPADDADKELESVEYDLDEEVEEVEVVEEATQLQSKVAAPKNASETSASPFTKAPKQTTVTGAGAPVKIKDGGAGNAGANKPKDNTPTNNMGIKPTKVSVPKV